MQTQDVCITSMANHAGPCTPKALSPPIFMQYERAVQLPREVVSPHPIVKLEDSELASGELDTLLAQVASPSSPPPLVKDRSVCSVSTEEATTPDDLQSLRSQLELSTYEHAALEERYRTLQGQYSDLRKLGQALNDVIHGSSSYEDEAISIEQLRTEAGHEGLRAKALKTDMIRPIIRGAGGLQFMMTQAQSISSLIEEAGGLEELRAVVADARRVRTCIDSIGGNSGLDRLRSQVQELRKDQQELAKLKAQLDKPDGLRAKVQKYSKLQQAFHAIETGVAFDSTQTCPFDAFPLAHKSQAVPDSAIGMNPARAQLLSEAPKKDFDQDLYEPKPPVTNPVRKTGSNGVPLGPIRGNKRAQGHTWKTPGKRQNDDEERMAKVEKRPRIDIGRASALVQATLASSNAISVPSMANVDRVQTPPTHFSPASDSEQNDAKPTYTQSGMEEGFMKFMKHVRVIQNDTDPTPIQSHRSSIDKHHEAIHRHDQPMIKQENSSNDSCTPRILDDASITSAVGKEGADALVAGYPTAL
ncbi:hypothetical protein DE146DRAFT_353270 [Phaeosphaeria sp. MPI-PUGE-AT-0046c]|nr:hypothetical protein DE146DRAFT_353270 [Phaeosphaeria sp. MPI-PUGE-AT-0046c]